MTEYNYRGFKAIIRFDEKENLYVGRVVGTEIHFEGATEDLAKSHCRRSINAFIDFRNEGR